LKLTDEQKDSFYKLFTKELLNYDGNVQLFADTILQYFESVPVENRDSQPNQQFCEWNYFDYPDNDLCFQPSCEQGKDNPFEFTNEFPKEYKFCHCCGKPIKIIEPPKDEDDSQN